MLGLSRDRTMIGKGVVVVVEMEYGIGLGLGIGNGLGLKPWLFVRLWLKIFGLWEGSWFRLCSELWLGLWDGIWVGLWDGICIGSCVGIWIGLWDGIWLGFWPGLWDGIWVGLWDGIWVGLWIGLCFGLCIGVKGVAKIGFLSVGFKGTKVSKVCSSGTFFTRTKLGKVTWGPVKISEKDFGVTWAVVSSGILDLGAPESQVISFSP